MKKKLLYQKIRLIYKITHITQIFIVGHGRSRRSTTFTGREDYLNQVTYLFGSQGGKTLELPAGVTTYSFACVLPESLPSSFEGKHGHLRYGCKVVVDRPWKADKEFRLSFSVIKTEDLNLSPELAIPSKSEIIRHFYCCCIKSKPFFMSVNVPYSGFVAGQQLDVNIFMNNQTNNDIEGTKVSLERNTQYISQTPHKKIRSETLTVKEAYGNGMRKSGSGEIKLSLIVPPLAPTNLHFCKVITTCYQLRIIAKVSGAHRNPHINIPIKIGTIPLRQSLPVTNMPAFMGSPSSNPNPSAPALLDLPPPSYEEAIRIEPDMGGEDANVSIFQPRYPVWNFSNNNDVIPSAPPENLKS